MREIKLSSGLSRYDTNAAFPIGDLELYVSNLPTCSGDFRLVAYMNGKKIDTYTLTRDNPRATVPRDKLSAGVFSCRVFHIQGEVVAQHFTVENLIITDVGDDLSAEPEITALNTRITELTEKMALSMRITELTEKTAAYEEAHTEKMEELNSALTKATENITTLESGLKTANENIGTVSETANNTKAQALAILKWMYVAQNSIPYLDAQTVDEFAASLGITLSDDEKEYIIGGKTE